MASVSSPTIRRRELAAQLRKLRLAKGLSIDEVAVALLVSPTKISRMETAQRGVSQRDVRDLLNLYGVDSPAQREQIMALAEEAKQPGWWQHYNLPYNIYIGLEAAAKSISVFLSSVLPGLLQTADYARALADGWVPSLSDDEKINVVEAKLARQHILTREEDRPQLHAVVDEAVIRRQVGGSAVMRTQLRHVVEVSNLPNVTVQVIPFAVGAHTGLESNFIILDIPSPDVNDVVYVEGLAGRTFLETPADLDRYRKAFDSLRNTALSPTDSVDFIARASRGK